MLALLALLAIAGVLLSRHVTNASRMNSELDALISDLQFARAQGIKQGKPMVVCASSDGATCSNTNSWQHGWMVCGDVNGSAICDAGDPVYRLQKAFNSTDTFTASGNTSALLFNREGFAVGLPGLVTITLHNATSTRSTTRCVAISAVGTLQAQKAGIGSCR